MDINDVYRKIHDNKIKLFSYEIPDVKAVTIELNKRYGIFVDYDKINNADDEFMVLSHEYGHCATGSTHKVNSKYDLICKHEYRANRRAILDFLPIDLLKQAIKYGCRLKHEFAEYLDLPEEFIVRALEHYKHMNLI